MIKKKEYVPAHPNCRCTYLSVWKRNRVPPEKPYTTKLIHEDSRNWSYTYNGTTFQIQGNTETSRNEFLEKYGLNIVELSPEEYQFLKIFTKDSSPLNKYLRFESDESKNSKAKLKNKEECIEKWGDINNYLIQRELLSEEVDFDDAVIIAENIFNTYTKELNEDVILCRRERNRYMGRNGKTTYEDKGFTSTTIHEYAKVEKYGDELNYILVPNGTKILYVEGITSAPEDYEIFFLPNIHLTHVEDLGSKKKVWKLS